MESKDFATILAARGNDGRPSDLEFMLRSHCQKLRVVEKLSGGSHLLIPSEQPSIAIRAYFPCDLEELSPSTCQDDDDFDNLRTFLNSFKSALVMFILPLDKQREQLDNPNSFFHRAQRVLRSMTIESVEANPDKTSRIFLLPDTESAIATLKSISKAMKKRDLKNAYFEKQRECHFLPQTCSSAIPMTSAPAAAKHVAEAFRDWANRFGFPPGEADVLMSLMGSLGGIATADDRVLESVPIDDRSKRILYAFFGSDGVVEQPAVATMTAAVTPSPFQIPLPPSVPPQQLAVASYIPHPMERAFATQVLVAPPLPSVVGTRIPFSNRTNSQPPSSCSTFPFPRQQAMHPPRNPSYAAPTSSPMGFSAAAAAASSSYCHQQNHMATTENMDAFCGVSYPTSSRAADSADHHMNHSAKMKHHGAPPQYSGRGYSHHQ